jgi:hypothetical protein
MGHFEAPLGSFTVHPHHPEDFLVLFYDTTLMVRVLHSPIPLRAVKIAFKRWNRANWVSAVFFDYQLGVGLVEIPAHLWLTSTTHEVLGSSCVVQLIVQESESKVNIKQFFVLVDCLHPDLVSTEKSMVAPIPLGTLGKLSGLRY